MGTLNGTLYALKSHGSVQMDLVHVRQQLGISSSPPRPDGTIYFGAYDNKVHASQ